jgi:molybdopterin molybdotransferase
MEGVFSTRTLPNASNLLKFDVGLSLILREAELGTTESIPIERAQGRILAGPIFSKVDLPPFRTSSVDGYAVRFPVAGRLKVIGEMPAGSRDYVSIGDNASTVQVFTGSLLPPDAEAVVMVEDAVHEGKYLLIHKTPEPSENFRDQGEEIKQGASLMSKGKVVTPPVLALLAGSGNSQCLVMRRPRVTIVETGNELRSPGDRLDIGAIYAANGLALGSAAKELGATVRTMRCKDDPIELKAMFQQARGESDFIVTSGGVSVGKHDLVKQIWKDLGAQEIFWKLAIRPGKPFFFARFPHGPLVFGLPGNPVSSLVTFQLAVRPALQKFLGIALDRWEAAKTSMTVSQHPDVEIFARVKLEEGVVYPIAHQGSHMSSGLAEANALARIPSGSQVLPTGSRVEALSLKW